MLEDEETRKYRDTQGVVFFEEAEIYKKLNTEKGRIKYHTGYLPRDREQSYSLEAMAERLASLAYRGNILLTQKRRGPYLYDYFASMPE